MTGMETHAGNIKLVGGWLCLDFANTLAWRGGVDPHEWLSDYDDLVSWGRHVGILGEEEAQTLLREGRINSGHAQDVYGRAIQLREAISRIFSAIALHSQINDEELSTLNREIHEAMTRLRIKPTVDGYTLAFDIGDDALDRMLWPIARSAMDLLISNKIDRIKRCSSEECGWLFLDMSRNRSRKWCDMSDCGNRSKARRYYDRKRTRALSGSEKI